MYGVPTVKVVTVVAFVTASCRAEETLPLNEAVPLYTATSEWLPPVRPLARPKVAIPLELSVAFPTCVPSTTRVTVPVGVPLVADTATDRVIAWPKDGVPLAGDVIVSFVAVEAIEALLPVSVTTVDDALAALLERLRVSVRVPDAVGAKVASSPQLSPAITVPPAAQAPEAVVDTMKSPVLPAA